MFGVARLPSVLLAACLIFAGAASVAVADPPDLYTYGQSYAHSTKTVSTSVFVWYPGQASSPWVAMGGARGAPGWDGLPAFWQSQIKQMMTANIDTMYVHVTGGYTEQTVNLFTGLRQLRAQGYDVPKVAPFLDPIIVWGNPGIDLSTTAGKDTFAQAYTDFYNNYDTANIGDPYADSYLAKIDNKPILATWHTFFSQNTELLSRTDVESRLSASLGAAHPDFNNGVYMVTTARNAPIINWSDERTIFFEAQEYYWSHTHSGVTNVQLKPGYWDQNIRNPGYFLPRDGGSHYRAAWESVQSSDPDRVYIESWNEYDEGSGMYSVDTSISPWIRPGSGNTNTDTWSSTNDSFEYIETTAGGARQWNDRPDKDASILWHNMPTVMDAGETRSVQVVVRNEGDESWTAAEDFKFGQKEYLEGEVLFGPARYLIDDTQDEIPIYGGIFRGRPIIFEFDLIAPSTEGDYLTHWGMLQENVVWFGEDLVVPITVVPEPMPFTWLTDVVGNWNNGENWSPGNGPPVDIDHAVINSAGALVTVNDGRGAATTSISAGELFIDSGGTLQSAITLTGGSLTGNGLITGTVTNSGGSIAPDDSSPGVLTVDGQYDHHSGSLDAAGVPEPAGLMLLALGVLGVVAGIRRHIRMP